MQRWPPRLGNFALVSPADSPTTCFVNETISCDASLRGTAQPERPRLTGYSTHVNALIPGPDVWRVAAYFAKSYAPAVMLLAERRGSPGLLVRPRPSRLEIGTEYLESRDDLMSVCVMVLAATIASWRACESSDTEDTLVPLATDRVEKTWQRPGLFVPRNAFGEDLYALGRVATLLTTAGTTEFAGARLAATWRHLRPIAATFATRAEPIIVDDLVDGRTPLPIERGDPIDPPVDDPPGMKRRPRRTCQHNYFDPCVEEQFDLSPRWSRGTRPSCVQNIRLETSSWPSLGHRQVDFLTRGLPASSIVRSLTVPLPFLLTESWH